MATRTVSLAAALLALALAGCQAQASVEAPRVESRPAPEPAATPAQRGFAFAQAHCTSCHAITRGGISPNPESPPFEAVVATPGLTRETLTSWLNNSHNFPDIMRFSIEPGQVDDLASYMLTLRESR